MRHGLKISPSGQETTLVTFTGANGEAPNAPLTLLDHELYGSTLDGGPDNAGVLFSVRTDGTKFSLLHTFSGKDGIGPEGPLIPGPAGVLYGITHGGGPRPDYGNTGVLFKLLPDGQYFRLHDFTGGADGGSPNALIIDASGTLYGSTTVGSACSGQPFCGVVFKYVPSTAAFTVLHQFTPSEGVAPFLGSIGPDGILYGATLDSIEGAGPGSLFELVPEGGAYSLTTLYSFTGPHSPGSVPSGGPILTRYGDLIGTTIQSPALYRFKNNKMKTLYTFPTSSSPEPPTQAKDGTIYGASVTGGISQCQNSQYNSCGYLYSFVQ